MRGTCILYKLTSPLSDTEEDAFVSAPSRKRRLQLSDGSEDNSTPDDSSDGSSDGTSETSSPDLEPMPPAKKSKTTNPVRYF